MRAIAVMSVLALSAVPSNAFAAPAYLLNKTVTVSSTTTASFLANGRPATGTRNTIHTIYISTQGNIFLRRVRYDRSASSAEEFATSTGINMRFEGAKLVGTALFSSGAARMVISFDPTGQSCTASIQFGRDNGRPPSWKGANGVTYTGTGPLVVSNVTCSVTAGNALAG